MTDELFDPFRRERPVDLTAFAGTLPWRPVATADAADLTALADRLHLDRLCVGHLASVFGADTRTGNELLLDVVAADERFVPFPVLNPTLSDVDRELDWLHDHGARGVRLVPGAHGYRLGDPAVDALVDRTDLPVQVCIRLVDPRLRPDGLRLDEVPPPDLAEFVRRHPGRPIVLSGLRATEWDDVRAHLNADDDTAAVLLDLWFVNGPVGVVGRLCAAGDATRWAYGSATPIQTAAATALQVAVADISPEQRHALCRGNAERILNRSQEQSP